MKLVLGTMNQVVVVRTEEDLQSAKDVIETVMTNLMRAPCRHSAQSCYLLVQVCLCCKNTCN